MGTKPIILGAGVAGISAGYHLKKKGVDSVIFEKDADWGGLCGNFTIDGFRFDRFVHFTFTKNEYVKNIFEQSSPTYSHPSVSSNYYQGKWLKHPAQNNLAPLSTDEKVKIIEDFINRPKIEFSEIKDYEQWLRVQYGNYFAENFPFRYTRKYWGVEPRELETRWVGQRMHSPDIDEVLRGAFETQDKVFYYTNFMRYPKKGGFRSILNSSREGLDIRFNKEVVEIIPEYKKVIFSDGTAEEYSELISSLPLPEITKYIKNCPADIAAESEKLRYTSGYMVSLGFIRPDVAKHLWFYIYDEDIPPARVYSPNLKSEDNVPSGCSSLQAEIFFSNGSSIPYANDVLNKTVCSLEKMGLFNKSEIIVKDIRFEKYANIIFDQNIYVAREKIINYLIKMKIKSIGRFGKWDYLWSDQSFLTGNLSSGN
ncbi:MAG: FAD-dependent oxidoreductase [Succinivibrio sp.]|nr:FAD-dependent oxidoreductase [Succinivibrio sp.]